ncbi:MAG: hypothetical protein CBARDMAM_5239 [uncultured Caballeronia sp.]|nr:MAG: hypothetical protein CBARDMAM_5239 [uncultured Caballeronia sp.]
MNAGALVRVAGILLSTYLCRLSMYIHLQYDFDRADQTISSTDLQKNTKTLLDRIASGEQDRYVVIRDNCPSAVLTPTERYEAIMNEIEDLRVEALARDRLATLKKATSISHAYMLAYFGKPD